MLCAGTRMRRAHQGQGSQPKSPLHLIEVFWHAGNRATCYNSCGWMSTSGCRTPVARNFFEIWKLVQLELVTQSSPFVNLLAIQLCAWPNIWLSRWYGIPKHQTLLWHMQRTLWYLPSPDLARPGNQQNARSSRFLCAATRRMCSRFSVVEKWGC